MWKFVSSVKNLPDTFLCSFFYSLLFLLYYVWKDKATPWEPFRFSMPRLNYILKPYPFFHFWPDFFYWSFGNFTSCTSILCINQVPSISTYNHYSIPPKENFKKIKPSQNKETTNIPFLFSIFLAISPFIILTMGTLACHRVYSFVQPDLLAIIHCKESLFWLETSGFWHTIFTVHSQKFLLDILHLLQVMKILQISSQIQSLHALQQDIDGINFMVGQPKALDMGLGNSWTVHVQSGSLGPPTSGEGQSQLYYVHSDRAISPTHGKWWAISPKCRSQLLRQCPLKGSASCSRASQEWS